VKERLLLIDDGDDPLAGSCRARIDIGLDCDCYCGVVAVALLGELIKYLSFKHGFAIMCTFQCVQYHTFFNIKNIPHSQAGQRTLPLSCILVHYRKTHRAVLRVMLHTMMILLTVNDVLQQWHVDTILPLNPIH
jgi:hypothetical protein